MVLPLFSAGRPANDLERNADDSDGALVVEFCALNVLLRRIDIFGGSVTIGGDLDAVLDFWGARAQTVGNQQKGVRVEIE